MGFSSCTNKGVTNKDIDEFIAKYKEVKFSEINNITITQRNSDASEVVYVVGKFGGNTPVYFATFDLGKETVTNINKTNLEKTKTKEYLTDIEIANAVNTIRKYDFYLLSVDSSENVFVNPYYANEPPYLLRLKVATGDSIIRKGYVYKLYKENWYINKTRTQN